MFDRFDIAEAHYCFAADYHGGQDSDLYRRLCRILDPDRVGLQPHADLCFDTLEDNGKAIYNGQEARHGFTPTAWEMSE